MWLIHDRGGGGGGKIGGKRDVKYTPQALLDRYCTHAQMFITVESCISWPRSVVWATSEVDKQTLSAFTPRQPNTPRPIELRMKTHPVQTSPRLLPLTRTTCFGVLCTNLNNALPVAYAANGSSSPALRLRASISTGLPGP